MDALLRSIVVQPAFCWLVEMSKTTRRAGLLLAALVPLASLQAQSNYATPYTFTTFAGVVDDPGSVDGTGSAARFRSPGSVAVDGSGNVYVADTYNHTIRKVTSGGVVTTLAGTAGVIGSDDGTGSAAQFSYPAAVAVDGAGNVYVADSGNNTIRKITPGGVVTTLAGTPGTGGSADGTGSAAQFSIPNCIAVDGSGTLYVADTGNLTIRKITPGGEVTTLAGTAGVIGSDDGTGSAARFNTPQGVTVDGSGNVYVADSGNNTIRKITPGAVVTTLAGAVGSPGVADGTGSAAQFSYPYGVAADASGKVYVADRDNHTIRKITSGGVVTTVAGTASNHGSADGTGSTARFNGPRGVAVDGSGNVYVADTYNHAIRKIASGAVVTTCAGTAPYGSTDGSGVNARFYNPGGVALDGSGNVYVADSYNHTIRKITSGGLVTTFAGTAGSPGSADGTGSAARFYYPFGVAVDGSGNVYVADNGNNTIRKITSGGVVSTLAGTAGAPGAADGTGPAARFYAPQGVAVDGSGNVYVADTLNNTIRMITSGGVVSTLAGTAGTIGSDDGTGPAAQFYYPMSVAVDGAGNIYVADTQNHTIRQITSGGVVTTLAGTAGVDGSADGTGSAAQFYYPRGVAVDGRGNIFVADSAHVMRKITSGGVVTTLAGAAFFAGNGDGTGSAAQFFLPRGLAVDGADHVYVADTNNCAIRKGVPLIAGDFNGDDKADIIWENTVTGLRGFWLMNGTNLTSWAGQGVVSTDWRIAGAADFNADGKTDIVWENTVTGVRGFWLMNGTALTGWAGLPIIPPEWRIAAVGDFNGDGKPDIVWENTVTGLRGFWLMNGTSLIGWVGLGTLTTDWRIAP